MNEILVYGCDTQARIDQCLSCTRPKCNNCLSGVKSDKHHTRDYTEALPYITGEMSSRELGKRYGVTPDTIRKWAKKYKEKHGDGRISNV